MARSDPSDTRSARQRFDDEINSVLEQATSLHDQHGGTVTATLTAALPEAPGRTLPAPGVTSRVATLSLTGSGVVPAWVPARRKRGRLTPAEAVLDPLGRPVSVPIRPGTRRRGDADAHHAGLVFSLRPTGRHRGSISVGGVELARLRSFRRWNKPWQVQWLREDIPDDHRTVMLLLAQRAGVGRRRTLLESDFTLGNLFGLWLES